MQFHTVIEEAVGVGRALHDARVVERLNLHDVDRHCALVELEEERVLVRG
jgi:hypothetical protein